jgi:DNA-binding MarR family transcriptional regulator
MHHHFTTNADQILLRAGPRADQDGTGAAGNGYHRGDRVAELQSSELARSIIKARALRRRYFDECLFSDPAWDILLELYALKCEDVRVSVSKLSIAASLPCTTALRWIDKLESECLVVRTADPLDGRRVWIDLSELGWRTMRTYLTNISTSQQGC